MEASDPRLDAILSRLQMVKKQGSGWLARCPAHDDKSPSLGIGTGRSGVLLYCRAGCSIDSIRKALDVPWSALFWEGEQIKQKNMRLDRRGMELESLMAAERLKGEANVLATLRARRGWAGAALQQLGIGWDGERLTIPVRDETDRLHDVLRYDPLGPPRFKMLQGKGRSRLPFPRPESIKNTICWIVEGEGSVFSMKSIGLEAVSLPGSAGKPSGDITRPAKFQGGGWHPAWARRFVQFQRAICIPDCDGPGRTLMATVSYDLRAAGVHTTVLDLGFQDGFDVGDFLSPAQDKETRRQARELLKMLDTTAMRQIDRLPDGRMELKYWYQFQTGTYQGPSNMPFVENPTQQLQEPVLSEKPSGESWGWGDV